MLGKKSNKRGSAGFFILVSIVYFMFGMILYQFLKPDIAIARTDLECAAPDTSGDMATCLIIGAVVPMAIIAILSVAAGYLTDRGRS